MDARKIAYTMAPALVRPKVDSKNALTEMKNVNSIMQFIIDNSARVFAVTSNLRLVLCCVLIVLIAQDRTDEEEAHAGRMPAKTLAANPFKADKLQLKPATHGKGSSIVVDDDDDDGPMSPSLSVLYGNTASSSNPLSPTASPIKGKESPFVGPAATPKKNPPPIA